MEGININEIKQQYPSLQKWEDHYAYEIYKGIMEEQIIKEFLYTVEPKKTAQQILKQIGYDIVYIDWEKQNDKIIKIKLTFRDILENNLKKVNDFMDKFGWYPAFIDAKNGGKYSSNVSKFFGYKNITIVYEPKYEEEVKTDRYLYHLTPDISYTKIKLNGLTPKSKSKLSDHPERIYLLNSTTMDEYEEIAYRLWEPIQSDRLKNAIQDYYLLQIDTSKLPNHKFFMDPNFYMGEGGVWTYQNIPPSAIKVHNLILVNPKPIIYEGYKIADERRNKFKEKFQNRNNI